MEPDERPTHDELLCMRGQLIELRDEALRQGQMEWAVTLSHHIRMMVWVIDGWTPK